MSKTKPLSLIIAIVARGDMQFGAAGNFVAAV
jgi:hypothetical protein